MRLSAGQSSTSRAIAVLGDDNEKPVTADTALRLGKFFKTGATFWMNMQARFDLETAEDVLAPRIKKIASYEAA